MKQMLTTHTGTRVYWTPKDELNTYLQIEVDENGYGELKEVYSHGDVYEVTQLTNLWVNFPEFNGAEYDTHVEPYQADFLKQTFNNIQKI